MSRLFCICFFGTKIYPIFARMSKNENIMNKVLIIDDEPQIRQLLARILGLEGYEVLQAGDCKAAVKQMEYSPNVILCDVFLPDGNGVDFIKTIKKISPESEIILLTAHGNIPDGVQAIKNGAFDYITKGDDNNKIIPLISRAMEKARTNGVKNRPEKETFQQYSFNSILGQSKPLLEAIALARKVASTDVPVLLTGETGTGKEVFAQAIHHESKRNKGNFVAINCSAFSKELLESEIFGHKAGSFTGALKDKKGLFEEAHNGTIFLDEIGEMAIELQAKLLRVLETGEYIKIGETKPTSVNVRIIAATNRNLPEEINAGHFREDLFYRLSVFQIHLPPLRERPGDIRLLTEAFVQSLSEKMTHSSKTVSKAFIDMLDFLSLASSRLSELALRTELGGLHACLGSSGTVYVYDEGGLFPAEGQGLQVPAELVLTCRRVWHPSCQICRIPDEGRLLRLCRFRPASSRRLQEKPRPSETFGQNARRSQRGAGE